MKRLDERLTPAAAAAASSQPIDHHAPYLLLQLETRMLEAIVLQLDTVDEAKAFRQTCRTIRAITTADGFARLWHAAHPDDVKAKAVLQRMKRHFHEEVDREELETVDADASRHHQGEIGIGPFPDCLPTQVAVNLLFSVIANGAGVVENQICVEFCCRLAVPHRLEDPSHPLGVSLIHLAAKGGNPIAAMVLIQSLFRRWDQRFQGCRCHFPIF